MSSSLEPDSSGLRPKESSSEAPWSGLVEDLRSAASSQIEPVTLARRHGLPQDFVEDVVAGSSYSRGATDFWAYLGRLLAGVLSETGKGIARVWESITLKPSLLIAGTTLIIALVLHVAFWRGGFYQPAVPERMGIGIRGLPGFFFLFTLGLFISAVFRWANYKRAMWGSAGLFVCLLPGYWATAASNSTERPVSQTFFFAIIGMTLAHLALGSVAAFLGSWASMRKEARDEGKLSRQEMLARLYDIEAALRQAVGGGRLLARKKTFKEWARTAQAFPLWGVLYGLGFGLVEVGLISSIWALIPSPLREAPGTLAPFQGLFNLVALALVWILGYYASGVWRGVMAGVIASGGRLLATVFPLGPYGLDFLRTESRGELLYFLLLAAACAGAFGGAAGLVDRRMAKGRRLKANDPAALVAEMVRLQRRLRTRSQGACVMAVDVARSTFIKSDADPLAIEYSFRGYQDMVALAASEYGGEVFSTAGDGALASFPSASDALLAAKTIQSRVYSFNEEVNRLNHPFRLRIGLHAGHTQAEFTEAPFNELIDVAAHVEAVSPVGGIACTEAFRRLCPEEPMAEVAASVDGHRVSIVLSPILTD